MSRFGSLFNKVAPAMFAQSGRTATYQPETGDAKTIRVMFPGTSNVALGITGAMTDRTKTTTVTVAKTGPFGVTTPKHGERITIGDLTFAITGEATDHDHGYWQLGLSVHEQTEMHGTKSRVRG